MIDAIRLLFFKAKGFDRINAIMKNPHLKPERKLFHVAAVISDMENYK